MNRDTLRAQMPELVRNFVPKNCRGFDCRVFDGTPAQSAMGFFVDPKPFAGQVVVLTSEAVIVKNEGKRNQFAVLDRDLVTPVPEVGAKVEVAPYARRRFDGLRADAPKEETRVGSDGQPYVVQSYLRGDASAKLPIPEPRCSELRQLIEQLEESPAPDGFRRITHLLVDAGARDFTWVDPELEDMIATPPEIAFTVSTAKFSGRVTIRYERGLDVYAIELSHDDGEIVERADCVFYDTLGHELERLIDDGSWKRIRVQPLPGRQSRH
jgi:hypothetical protein